MSRDVLAVKLFKVDGSYENYKFTGASLVEIISSIKSIDWIGLEVRKIAESEQNDIFTSNQLDIFKS